MGWFRRVLWVAVLVATALLGVLYVSQGGPDNGGAPQIITLGGENGGENGFIRVEPSKKTAAVQPDTAKRGVGEMAKFIYAATPEPIADVTFLKPDGTEMTLSDFRGKTVLLNLWATWCAPCKKEMPDLDRLQAELGSDAFEVVALSIDRTGVSGAQEFFDDVGVTNLKAYADPTTRLMQGLKLVGLPTTFLIDAQGRRIGTLIGPAKWDGTDAVDLIKAELAKTATPQPPL